MQFEKITALGGTMYRCLLFDNVTVAASDSLDSEAFPMPASNGEFSLQITSLTDNGTADFICTGSNIPGDADVSVIAGADPIVEDQTKTSGASLTPFTLIGVLYPRVRIVNTSTTEPITVTAYLSIMANESTTDPTDYTSHIPCSDIQRQVKRRYKSPIKDQDLLDIINEMLRDIALKTEYFRADRTIALTTSTDEYKITDDLRKIKHVYDGDGGTLQPITIAQAARDADQAWWERTGTVEKFIVEGVPLGYIRPYPLPDSETQSMTVRYIYAPAPLSYLSEYVPIERMFTKVIVDYIVAQLYGDENDAIDLNKERYRMLSYFSGRNDIVSYAAGNTSDVHEMEYRRI